MLWFSLSQPFPKCDSFLHGKKCTDLTRFAVTEFVTDGNTRVNGNMS